MGRGLMLRASGHKGVLSVLRKYIGDVEVSTVALDLVRCLAMESAGREAELREGGLDAVLTTLERHQALDDLLAAAILQQASSNPPAMQYARLRVSARFDCVLCPTVRNMC